MPSPSAMALSGWGRGTTHLRLLVVFLLLLLQAGAVTSAVLTPRWSVNVGFATVLYPTYAGVDMVILGGARNVTCLNTTSGAVVWTSGAIDVSDLSEAVLAAPVDFAVVKAAVIASTDNQLVALNLQDGRVRWSINASAYLSAYAVDDHHLLLGRTNDDVNASLYDLIDVQTGKMLHPVPSLPFAWSEAISKRRGLFISAGRPQSFNGTLITAFCVRSMSVAWSKELLDAYVGVFDVFFAGNTDDHLIVLATTFDGDNMVFVLDARTGSIHWSDRKPGGGGGYLNVGNLLGSFGDVGVFAGTDAGIKGVDLLRGATLWSVETWQPVYEHFFSTSVTADGRLAAYMGPTSPSDEYLWPFSLYNVTSGALLAFELVPYPGRGSEREQGQQNPTPIVTATRIFYMSVNRGLCMSTAIGDPVEQLGCLGADFALATTAVAMREGVVYTWSPSRESGFVAFFANPTTRAASLPSS